MGKTETKVIHVHLIFEKKTFTLAASRRYSKYWMKNVLALRKAPFCMPV